MFGLFCTCSMGAAAASQSTAVARDARLTRSRLYCSAQHLDGRHATDILGARMQLSQYIALLPDSVDLPCFWTPSERDQLHSASLRAAIEEQAAQWNGYYTQLMASSPACGVSHADFTWAMSCVSSRTFTGPYIGSSVQVRRCSATLFGAAWGGESGVQVSSILF